MDENSCFMEFLRVLDASIGVQDINILLFMDNCGALTARYKHFVVCGQL